MEPKKPAPGARDLTDLKAKLGLVKPGAAVPTPGVGSPVAVPGQPVGPPADPKRDPFAQVHARPIQQVIIADAGPQMAVPDMKKSKAPFIIGTVIALALAAVGFGGGLVYRARILHNMAIVDANQIKEEVAGIRKTSQPIYNAIVASVNRAKGDIDLELVTDLKKLGDLTPPKTDKIFKTNYALLDNLTIDRLFNYYNDTIRLYELTNRFVRDWGKEESQAELQKIISQRQASGQTTYGVVIDGSGDLPLGMLVEVGQPVCKTAGETECGVKDIAGFQVRTDVTGRWNERKARGTDAERVIPIKPDTALAEKILAGGIEAVAARQFRIQLAELILLSRKLTEIEKNLIDDLNKAAGAQKVFTF